MLASLIVSCNNKSEVVIGHAAKTDTIMDRASEYLNRAQLTEALHHIDSSFNAFDDAGPQDLWRKYSFLKNFHINYRFDVARARMYADSMELVIKNYDSLKLDHAYTYFAQADVFMAEKKYAEAFAQYYNGYTYAVKNLDSCAVAPFANQLGLVKYRQMRYSEAIPYIKQALAQNAFCRDSSSFECMFYLPQSMLNTVALCFDRLSVTDSAILYYKKNLDLLAQRESMFPSKVFIEKARGVVYGNLGGVYAKAHRFDSAEYYLKESIRLNARPGYEVNDAATARIKLTDLYLKFGKYAEAKAEVELLKEHINKLNLISWDSDVLRLNTYKTIWTYYDKIKDIPAAYIAQQKYYEFSDSLKNAESGLQTADMDGAFAMRRQQYQLSLLRKDAQLKTVYLVGVIVVTLMAGGMLLIVWKNLKRSRIVNEQIRKQNSTMQQALNALEQSQAENTRMMKIVAHDLRNPLGGIKMAASLMARDLVNNPKDMQMLDIIKRSADNSLALVEEILQINNANEELKREPVDLENLIGHCIAQLKYKADAKSQKLISRVRPVTISVNSEKIWRVVSNMISNAIKFSPPGSDIFIRLERRGRVVLIAIQDNGIGIPESNKDKIFDFFTEAKRKGTAGEEPFGLGMAISKQIVDAHSGKIWFESIENEGTTFYVELPFDADAHRRFA